jgi:hypothetical protein
MKSIPFFRGVGMHRRIPKLPGVVMAGTLLLAMMSCENRLPTEQEPAGLPARALLVSVDPAREVIAQVDTLQILAQLVDSNRNVITDAAPIRLGACRGLVLTDISSENRQSGTHARYLYPHAIDTILTDTLTAWYTTADEDTLRESIALSIRPRSDAVGHLEPAHINVEIRTDSVYKAGGAWNMFVDAKVFDQMGNPVRDGRAVVFTFEESGVDTSLLGLRNLAQTGARTVITDGVGDSVVGNAISVLTYLSEAISKTVIVRATVVNDTGITSLDTLPLPLPTPGLKIEAHDNNAETIIVRGTTPDTASIRVTVRDAFNVPIAGRYVKVTAKPGIILPLCPVYDGNGTIIGSRSCTCDTVFLDSCLVRDSLDPAIITDTICTHHSAVHNCEPLPYTASGITNADGEFIVKVVLISDHIGDEANPTTEVFIELKERITHKENDEEFSFPIFFK